MLEGWGAAGRTASLAPSVALHPGLSAPVQPGPGGEGGLFQSFLREAWLPSLESVGHGCPCQPLTWEVGLGALGPTRLCESGLQKVLRLRASPRGVGSTGGGGVSLPSGRPQTLGSSAQCPLRFPHPTRRALAWTHASLDGVSWMPQPGLFLWRRALGNSGAGVRCDGGAHCCLALQAQVGTPPGLSCQWPCRTQVCSPDFMLGLCPPCPHLS